MKDRSIDSFFLRPYAPSKEGWRNDFRGGGTRFQGAQGDPFENGKAMGFDQLWERVQFSQMIKTFKKWTSRGPAMLTEGSQTH